MEKAIEQLQETNSEHQIQEEVLQLSSPLVSEHINFMGKYNEQLNEGEFRPLGQ